MIFISFTNIWNAQKLDLFFKVVEKHYNQVRGLFSSLSRKHGIEVEIRSKEFSFFFSFQSTSSVDQNVKKTSNEISLVQ